MTTGAPLRLQPLRPAGPALRRLIEQSLQAGAIARGEVRAELVEELFRLHPRHQAPDLARRRSGCWPISRGPGARDNASGCCPERGTGANTHGAIRQGLPPPAHNPLHARRGDCRLPPFIDANRDRLGRQVVAEALPRFGGPGIWRTTAASWSSYRSPEQERILCRRADGDAARCRVHAERRRASRPFDNYATFLAHGALLGATMPSSRMGFSISQRRSSLPGRPHYHNSRHARPNERRHLGASAPQPDRSSTPLPAPTPRKPAGSGCAITDDWKRRICRAVTEKILPGATGRPNPAAADQLVALRASSRPAGTRCRDAGGTLRSRRSRRE